MEQIVMAIRPSQLYYWATYSGAELDMFFIVNGKRYGIEFKFSEAPRKDKVNDHCYRIAKTQQATHSLSRCKKLACKQNDFCLLYRQGGRAPGIVT